MLDESPRVLGVLAGGDMPAALLRAWADSADVVLAADGGFDRLAEAGLEAPVTIGDMDSIQSQSAETVMIRNSDQDSSDCDKLLAYAAERGYSGITLACVEGDRLDHILGTLASACRSPLQVRLALRGGMGWVLNAPIDLTLPCEPGEVFSLMPLALCEQVSLAGVRWPLKDVNLAPQGLVSLSNLTSEQEVGISVRSGLAAMFVYSARLQSPNW